MAGHRHREEEPTVWQLQGQLKQLIYSPRGEIEGLLIDVDEVPAQFVLKPHEAGSLAALRQGQTLVLEGTEQAPSHKGEAEHSVFEFVRLVSVDGNALPDDDARVFEGVVVRFNYARHGQANGVVLDTGDFIHLRPEGFAQLGLTIGSQVHAQGEARPLATGDGQVVEATEVNGHHLP